jgi:hypothetical protein
MKHEGRVVMADLTTTKVKYVQGDLTKYEDLLSAYEDTD